MPEIEPDVSAVEAFVADFRGATGFDGPVGSFAFGDSPQMADALGRLVLDGPKRATAGLAHEDDAAAAGQHDVVLAGDGSPLCLIRTTEVRTVPFSDSDPAFAWDEGEGDRTFDWWRDAHVRFFTRREEATGIPFADDSLVHLERFEVVWPETAPPAPLHDADGITVRAVRPDDRAWVQRVTGDATDEDGWPTDRLPALLARRDLQTAGVLVFRPRPNGAGATEIVAVALLEDDPAVDDALRTALRGLAREHRWGHPKG